MARSRGGNGEGSYYYDDIRKRWIWRRRIVDADGTHRRITLTASKRADLAKKVRQYQDNYALTNGLSGNFKCFNSRSRIGSDRIPFPHDIKTTVSTHAPA